MQKNLNKEILLEMCGKHKNYDRGPFERKESWKECPVGELLQCKVKNYFIGCILHSTN